MTTIKSAAIYGTNIKGSCSNEEVSQDNSCRSHIVVEATWGKTEASTADFQLPKFYNIQYTVCESHLGTPHTTSLSVFV